MSFEVEGTLHKKFDTEKKTDTFQAREFILLLEEGNYPQYIKFQLTQDRVAVIDSIEEGATIKVYFDLRGREWQGKYFTNLQAWRVESAAQPARQASSEDEFAGSPPPDQGSAYDDLPF